MAATNVDINNCVVIGPDQWYYHGCGGTADQIGVYGVQNFSVIGNVSNNGGDYGIVCVDCQNGIVSGNTCTGNFGPGISHFPQYGNVNITVVGNTVGNNCRRSTISVTSPSCDGKTPTPGEIDCHETPT